MSDSKCLKSEFDDDEDIWISGPHFSKSNPLHVQIHDLEQGFRCRICQNFLRCPVSLVPCMHTYCSECIRQHFKTGLKSMKRAASCPECRVVVDTKGAVEFSKCLVPNRSIELACTKFQEMRSSLHCALAMSSKQNIGPNPDIEKSYEHANHSSNSDVEEKNIQNLSDCTLISNEECKSELNNECRTSVSSNDDEVSSSPCPLTKRKITLYKMLKKKQLQELCAKDGLPTHGTEEDLIQRHEAFVTLYNAECDSFKNPRSQQEIVSEIIQREQARSLAQRNCNDMYNNEAASQCIERLKDQRKKIGELKEADSTASSTNTPIPLSSGNRAFDKQMKSIFSKLIVQGKERMMLQKGSSEKEHEKCSLSEEKPQVVKDDVNVSTVIDENQNSDTTNQVDTNKPSPSSVSSESSLSRKSSRSNSTDVISIESTKHRVPSVEREVAKTEISSPTKDLKTLQSPVSLPNGRITRQQQTMHSNEDNTKCNKFPSRDVRRRVTTDSGKSSVGIKRESYDKDSSSSIEESLIGPWDCSVCTYRNEKNRSSRATCEICGNPRPKRKLSPNSMVYRIDC